MSDWPHQTAGVQGVRQAIERGEQRIALTSPTGGGKSRMMLRMMEWGWRTVVYANRKTLIEQLSEGLTASGVPHGIMAAGYAEETQHDIQIASTQTVEKRVTAGKWNLHPARLVMIDEAHNEKGERMRSIIDSHIAAGAFVVGITATPVGIGGIYNELVQAGTTSELRGCGALLPAQTFAPDEPSAKAFKSKAKGLLQFADDVREVMLPVVFGRVWEHYQRLNPDGKPAILFAPGVSESLWFTEKLWECGISAAHIDGEKIVYREQTVTADRDSRAELKRRSEAGDIELVSNRFVMREGVDWTHLAHAVFACTFGGVCGYLQSGGRVLRNHPSLDHVVIQDHGGNFWRHDSLNADRIWSLDDTEAKIAERKATEHREKKEPEPIVCPKCSKVRASGVECRACGFAYRGRKRMVIETDGSLRPVHGDIHRPRRVSTDPADHKAWKACVYRCKNAGRTFRQARALFQRENGGRVPGPDFPLMPQSEGDWFARVRDVEFHQLSGARS